MSKSYSKDLTHMKNNTTRRHKRKPYRYYVIYNQEASALLATATSLTITDRRVLDAAVYRMDDCGHAVFGRGELQRLLSISRRAVYYSKKRLWKAGFLAEYSGGETCVWVSETLAFREGRGSHCPFHR